MKKTKCNLLIAVLMLLAMICTSCQTAEDIEATKPTYWETELSSIAFEEFRTLISNEVSRRSEELIKQKDSWFDEYNGEKVQVISLAEAYQKSEAVVFYWADEGESINDILTEMVDVLMEPYYTPAQRSDYVVTKHFLDVENQLIYNSEDVNDMITDYAWEYWQGYGEILDDQYNVDLSKCTKIVLETLPISGDNIWFIPYINGYYQYKGDNGYLTWEEYTKTSGHLMKDGCMPFLQSAASQYILIREGDVYRLQRADSMGYLWK